MREYAFDVKLYAVVRVKAASRVQAEEVLGLALDCADLNVTARSPKGSAHVTEASISVDDEGYPYLCEVDGIDVDDDENEAQVHVDDFDISG